LSAVHRRPIAEIASFHRESSVQDAPQRVPREPWLAANLSLFVPGLGHIHAGKRTRGAWCLVALAGLWAIGVGSLLSPGGSTWVLIAAGALLALLQVLAAFDAHRLARLANDAQFESERRATRDPWLAVLLSRLFIPGVGHIYLGRRLAGVLLLVASVALLAMPDSPPIASLLVALLLGFACFDAYRSSPVRREASMRPILWIALLVTVTALASTAAGAALRTWVIQAFREPSESMLPTLRPGDFFFVSKSPGYVPGRGDVVVFHQPFHPKTEFIKRIVGLPGDTLAIRKRLLYANGFRLDDPHAFHPDPQYQPAAVGPRDDFGPRVLAPGEYFVLGDNRENSNDSRYWGPVARDLIEGRAFKIYWPLARAGPIR
jgi:signal peptidase I